MYVRTREGILKSGPFNVQSKLGFLLQGSRQTNISEIFSLSSALHQMREWLCRLCSRCYVGHTHFAILENCLLTMSNISITFLLMQQNQSHVFLVLVSGARKWTDPVSKLTPYLQSTIQKHEPLYSTTIGYYIVYGRIRIHRAL